MPGNFWKYLRPRTKNRPRGPFTVAGYVVDQWRRLAYGGVAVGLAGAAFGGVAVWWGLHVQRMPPTVSASFIDHNGMMVQTYFSDGGDALDERIVGGVLKNLIWHQRTLTPDEPLMYDMLQQTTMYFKGAGAQTMRDFLRAQDFFKPLIEKQRMHRVVEPPIEARRIAGTQNSYRVTWTEHLERDNGGVVDGSRQQKWMEAQIQIVPRVSSDIAKNNPFGIFITDYSWNVTS